MSNFIKLNPFAKTNNNTGFGTSASSYGGRFVNKDGSFNVRKEGVAASKRISVYHSLLSMPVWTFIGVIVIIFISVNLFYTGLYYLAGLEGLTGFIPKSRLEDFWEVYFFSCETFTTVGYGRMNPTSFGCNLIAATEALSGFLSFAVATGLIYGRFTRPNAYMLFSQHAVVAPYQGVTGLMFRLATYKPDHVLTDVEVRVNLSLTVMENGQQVFKFYNLELERSKIDALSMNLTVVHPITESSPLYGLTADDLAKADAEMYILVRGYDEVFTAIVQQRTSYTHEEVVFNAKFLPMYRESEDGKTTILELQKISHYRVLSE